MRREIKLIILVFVLVVGPAIALSFLAARVLESWQIVLQKRMSGEAGRVLDEAVSVWDQELASLRSIPDTSGLSSKAIGSWVAHAAGLTARHSWLEGVFVFQAGAKLFYPAGESTAPVFESNPSGLEVASLLNQGGVCLARGDTNAAIKWLEKAGGVQERNSESRIPHSVGATVRDPDEGFFYDLIALRRLAEIGEVQGRNSYVAEIREIVLKRVLARYDELVPLQRELMIQWIEERSEGPPGLQAQWRERMRARTQGVEEGMGLAGSIRLIEPTLPEAGWAAMSLKADRFLVTKIGVGKGGALILALKFNEAGLIGFLNHLFAGLTSKTEIRIQCERVGIQKAAGSSLASRQLSAPLEMISLMALPADIPAFVANARLQTWLYRGSGVLLIISVAAGVWLVWREAVSEIQLARERSDFVATVSHDLRTPLSSMRMLAESLYMGNVPDVAKQKKFLGAIIKESDRLSRLTDRALYFIRYGQGALRYQFTEGDLGEVVREAVRVNGEWLMANGEKSGGGPPRIEVDIPPDFPHVKFDAGAIEQVVHNLLDNAVKYSRRDDNTPIHVQLSIEDGGIVLSVQDHGIGMTPEEIRQIMRPYVRGKSAARQNTRGIGLGLALCQHIVQAHGGRIQIESELGKGSKFSVILP